MPEMSTIMQQIRESIAEEGWHGIGVGGDPTDPDHPYGAAPFTYTVGLWDSWDHPDLIISGLSPVTAHSVLRGAVEAIQGGRRFEAGPDLFDGALVGYPVRFGEVGDAARSHLMVCAAIYDTDRGETPALQLLWPTADGLFPGDPGYSDTDDGVDVQRVLA